MAERTVHIAAPVALVRSQFGDVAHHQRRGVHRRVRFEVISDGPDVCRYRQVTRFGPFRSTQELELARRDVGPLVNVIRRGPFRGSSIVFDITAIGANRTMVVARLDSGQRALRALRPVISRLVGPALASALAEDRRDLEGGGYELTVEESPAGND